MQPLYEPCHHQEACRRGGQGLVDGVLPLGALQHAEADFQRPLIRRHDAMFQEPPQCGHLTPSSAPECLTGPRDGLCGGFGITHGRSPHQYNERIRPWILVGHTFLRSWGGAVTASPLGPARCTALGPYIATEVYPYPESLSSLANSMPQRPRARGTEGQTSAAKRTAGGKAGCTVQRMVRVSLSHIANAPLTLRQ
jgi:hypothetical protein